MITVSVTGEEIGPMEVILNEKAIIRTLFAKTSEYPLPLTFVILYTLFEANLQNNECQLESMIGIVANQSFDNQTDCCLEERGLIKLNMDNYSGVKEISKQVAKMSVTGSAFWNINKITLPIKMGRYSGLIKHISSLLGKKGSKFKYAYNNCNKDFQRRAIAVTRKLAHYKLNDCA